MKIVLLFAFASVLPVRSANIDPSTIINIGKSAWEIIVDSQVIEKGSPSDDTNGTRSTANGVPEGIANWTMMEGWTPSSEKRYTFKMHDPLHIPFLQYDYSLSFVHSASYNGVGHYLAEVRLVPEMIWLNWGAGKLNAEVEIRHVLNAGTKNDPVAGIELVHRFSQKNFFQDNLHTEVFFIKGNGDIVCQSGPACEGEQKPSRAIHV